MSEGNPENWAAVAWAISDRVRELGWRQCELAERSHVPLAVVREIQRRTVERRPNRRTLEALAAVARGPEPGRLDGVLKGHAPRWGSHAVPDGVAVLSGWDPEHWLDEISKLFKEFRSGIATVIDHVRDDR